MAGFDPYVKDKSAGMSWMWSSQQCSLSNKAVNEGEECCWFIGGKAVDSNLVQSALLTEHDDESKDLGSSHTDREKYPLVSGNATFGIFQKLGFKGKESIDLINDSFNTKISSTAASNGDIDNQGIRKGNDNQEEEDCSEKKQEKK